MDNRFKFRAWNVGVKEYTYWDRHEITMDWNDRVILAFRMAEDQATYITTYSGLEQCTAATAASSYRGESEAARLIYEGDIIHSDEWMCSMEVRWDSHMWVLCCDDGDAIPLDELPTDAQIIRTIHDGPVLEGEGRQACT